MKTIPIENYPQDMANAFMNGIAFVNEVRVNDSKQLATLMHNAVFAEMDTGEVIIRAGNKGRRYYFLLRGQLCVYPDDDTSGKPINKITPGQNFGGLSIICDTERSATVAVEKNCKSALVLTIDLSGLGQLEDFSVYTLQTKLSLYKAIVNNTRWQLELYKMDYPKHTLTLRGRKVDIYIGKKNTQEELASLEHQAYQLLEMLLEWNQALQFDDFKNQSNEGTWI
jgi:CRP/FNR family cyclic AMP-dependent transcriptional regulator